MNKKELTLHKTNLRTLASSKGFVSKFLYDGEFKYAPEKEKLRWLFWKTELKQWVQDQIRMYIAFYPDVESFDDVIIAMLKSLPDVK